MTMHKAMAATMDRAIQDIRGSSMRLAPRANSWDAKLADDRVAQSQGVDGPKVVDGLPVEGTFRAHQVPLSDPAKKPEHLKQLEAWLKSYKPEELFDDGGKLKPELQELSPVGDRRMGANPRANGGLLLKDLRLPDYRDYAIKVKDPAPRNRRIRASSAKFLRDIIKLNQDHRNSASSAPMKRCPIA